MRQEKPLSFIPYPYRKPTQVDEERILRPAEEALSRNSAKWPRNLGCVLCLFLLQFCDMSVNGIDNLGAVKKELVYGYIITLYKLKENLQTWVLPVLGPYAMLS